MPITGRTRYYANKSGIEGFQARRDITDDLIQRSLAQKRQTTLDTTQMDITAAQKRVDTQQSGETSRQRIANAADIVLQELRGAQEKKKDKRRQIAEMAQIEARGAEERKTKEAEDAIGRNYLESVLKRLGGTQQEDTEYTYDPKKYLSYK